MQTNLIELLMMPGIGSLCGAIPFEDIFRKSKGFAPLSKQQQLAVNLMYMSLPIIAGFIGYIVFKTFSAMAIGAAFAVLWNAFNPFAKFRSKGLWAAGGAALCTSPFLLVLFGIMWLTGYGVLGKQKAIAMMSGIIGTALLSPSTPALILHAFQLQPFADRTEHTIFTVLLCFTMFIRHLEDIRAIMMQNSTDTEL